MAKQSVAQFEHRHTHDRKFLRSFYWHSLSLSPVYMVVWAGLFVLGMVFAVQTIREGSRGTGLLCGVAALVCLVRGFIAGWVRLLREYNGMVKEYGKDGWESVMRFGDKIGMLDDGRSTAEVEWSDCRKLEDQGAWLCLEFRDGLGSLFLRKSDFSKGTAAEFCAWLAQEHPEIKQSVKN